MAVGESVEGTWSSGAGKCLDGCGPKQAGYHRSAALEENNILWTPGIAAADEQKLYERDTIQGRSQDLVRNDPQVGGALRNEQAAIVGHNYALDIKLHARFLGLKDGQAGELQEEIEDAFDRVAESPRAWFDAAGRNTFSQLARQVLFNGRSYGESISVLKDPANPTWLSDRDLSRPTQLSYLAVDPGRLRTPSDLPLSVKNNSNIYHGIDRALSNNYPLRYYFINNDRWDATVKRKRKPNEKSYTSFRRTDQATGAWLVLHCGDFTGLPNDTRPLPPLANIVHLVRMSGKYSDAVLDQAWKSAMLGLVIESDIPTQIEALFRGINEHHGENNASKEVREMLPWQLMTQSTVQHFQQAGTKVLDSVKGNVIPTGNKVNMLDPGQPTQQHEAYTRSLDRKMAMGLGHSYESLTGDSSQSNFHGAMMQDIEQWRRRRLVAQDLPASFGRKVVQNWLLEQIVDDNFSSLKLGGDPVSRMKWWLSHQDGFRIGFVGPGREWANPVVMENTLKQGLENNSMSVDEHTKRVYGRRARDVENENQRAEERRARRLQQQSDRLKDEQTTQDNADE